MSAKQVITENLSERTLLDPTAEQAPTTRERAARPESLEGKRIGILDISKARGDVFCDRLDELLAERGVHIERFRKPTFAKPAPADLRYEISTKCDLVVEALAD